MEIPSRFGGDSGRIVGLGVELFSKFVADPRKNTGDRMEIGWYAEVSAAILAVLPTHVQHYGGEIMKRYTQSLSRVVLLLVVVALFLTFAASAFASGGDSSDVAPEAKVVQNGHYVIWAFPVTMTKVQSDVASFVKTSFPNQYIQWKVVEEDHTDFVIAYPAEGEGNLTSEIDQKIKEYLVSSGSVCIELNDWFFGLSSSKFYRCGYQGTTTYFSNLAYYGFDDKASSYYEWYGISPGCKVYDIENFYGYLTDLDTDVDAFPSWLNNKISSLIVFW